jgi:HAMP domain-containing protein
VDSLLQSVSANSATFILVALIVSVVALVLAAVAMVRLASALKPLRRLKESEAPEQILPAVLRLVEETEGSVSRLTKAFETHLSESRAFTRYVGLVRYDAFEDIAGQQSFSMALLDSDRNGVILTYLTSKNSARSYAIAIKAGEAPRKLSDEELRALNDAEQKAAAPVPEPASS